ncbi:hypothetical protein SISSUDRAFT_1033907 [Sistotremastrum suecicum HHB10207 ss-3]|uniref:Uncharacterized protein n=1 Tax=Sistotremastrum suecicum HHB10207 ss-3 TaxID=1314776 RepID=A0A166CRV0_9AGAM|nr:hypothetical protein SISSUDRAFT_1033907 [Sistotremastrum suecicum HHB10207 ss-3]
MSTISQVHVNSEKHSGAVEVLQHASSNKVASFADNASSFKLVKTHAVGEGVQPYEAGGHYVIRPKLFPQVAAHAIFDNGKAQLSNKTPYGEVHIIFDAAQTQFTLDNQHSGDLHVKYTPPAKSSAADSKAYLGTFSDAENLKPGQSHVYQADGHYAIRSTLDSDPANVFSIDFIGDKIHFTNGNPAGEIAIAFQKA